MSQSDYIQFIKTADLLKNNKQSPVLTEQDYTTFEKYALETTVQNTKNSFSRLIPQNTTVFKTIFPNTDPVRLNIVDMEKKVSSCPTFKLCINTNTRPNRVLNSFRLPIPTYRLNKNYAPKQCQYKYGKNIIRTIWCGKKICKCRTRYLTPNADPSIKKAYYKGNELTV
jgi:hypothetical protein